jgi:hypothetical protein
VWLAPAEHLGATPTVADQHFRIGAGDVRRQVFGVDGLGHQGRALGQRRGRTAHAENAIVAAVNPVETLPIGHDGTAMVAVLVDDELGRRAGLAETDALDAALAGDVDARAIRDHARLAHL